MRQLSWVLIGTALFLAPSSWAQSLPSSDAASEAESLPSTEAATQPGSLSPSPPPSATSTPSANATEMAVKTADSAGSQLPWGALIGTSVGVGVGIVTLSLMAAALTLVSLNPYDPQNGPPPAVVAAGDLVSAAFIVAGVDILASPVAVLVGAAFDTQSDSEWWPKVAGTAVGFLAYGSLVAVATLYWMFRLPGYFSAEGVLIPPLLAPLAAPAVLGGLLLGDMLFRPKPDAPAKNSNEPLAPSVE